MAETTAPVGKRYPATEYAIGREKIREYARAVGESNPLHLDLDAARAAGHPDLVAPPMFAVVFCYPAIAAAMFDPEVPIDVGRLVHGGQEFVWERLLVAGDEVTTVATLEEVRTMEAANLSYYTYTTRTADAAGEPVVRGVWTNIVRGATA